MAVTEAANDTKDADAIRTVLDEAVERLREISKDISPTPREMSDSAP